MAAYDVPIVRGGGREQSRTGSVIEAATKALQLWFVNSGQKREESAAAAKLVPYLSGLDQKTQGTLMARLSESSPEIFRAVASQLQPTGPDPLDVAKRNYEMLPFADMPSDATPAERAAAILRKDTSVYGKEAMGAPWTKVVGMGALPAGDELPAMRRDFGLEATANELEATKRNTASVGATRQGNQLSADVARERMLADKQIASTRATQTANGKPANAFEKRAMNFYLRASEAAGELEKLEPKIQKLNLAEQTRLKFAPNLLQSEDGQIYTQLQRQFTEARLRKDSGAAIPEHEYVNDRQTYFAQPGDGQKTLERKRVARQNLLSALKQEAGRAVGEYYGDEDAVQPTPDVRVPSGAPDLIQTPDGKKWRRIGGNMVEVNGG